MPSNEVTTWRFRLFGDDIDLDNALRLFNADELRVERRNGPDGEEHIYLCSTRFDGIEGTQDGQLKLRDLSTRLLSIMNGALRLHCGSLPLIIEDQVAENADGTLGVRIVPASGLVRLGISATATPEGGGPSAPEQWALADDPNGEIEDALVHYSRGDNWFDLWKAFEVIQAAVKTSRGLRTNTRARAEIAELSNQTCDKVESFCDTANHYRHDWRSDREGRSLEEQRISLIDIRQGQRIVAQILRAWLAEKMTSLPYKSFSSALSD